MTMATSRAGTELLPLVTCFVCFNNFRNRDPIILSCLHAFCIKCLEKIYITKISSDPSTRGRVTCPTCLEETTLPEGSVHQLMSYCRTRQVIDALNVITRDDTDDVYYCTRCKNKNDVAAYCFDCSNTMCDGCVVKHDRRPGNKTHVNIAVNRSNITSLVCRIHQEYAEDFCITCNSIMCETCHDSSHHGHTFKAFRLTNPAQTDVISNIDELCKSLNHFIQNLKDQETEILKDVNSTKDEIDQHIQKLINDLTAQGDKLKSQLIKLVTPTEDKIQACEHEVKELKRRRRIVETTISAISDIPGLSLDDDPDILPQSTTADSQLPKYKLLKFVAGSSTINLGELQTDLSVISQSSHQSTTVSSHTGTKPRVRQVQQSQIPSSDIQSLISTRRPTLIWSKNIYSYAYGFLSNGNLIVRHNDTLALYDQHGTSLPVPLDTRVLGAVYGLTVHHGTNTMVVTGDLSFTTIFLDTTPWTYVTHQISVTAEAVDFTPDGQHVILVVWGDPGKLTKYRISGKKCWCKNISGSDDVTVTHDGRIITCQGYLSTLIVFSNDGVRLGEFIRQEDREKVGNPRGLCVDSLGNIYVRDLGRGVVCMLDKQGRYVKDVITGLDTEDSTWNTHRSPAISLYKDQLLVVSDQARPVDPSYMKLYSFQ